MSCEAKCVGGGLRDDVGTAGGETLAPDRQGEVQSGRVNVTWKTCRESSARLHQFLEIFAEPWDQGTLGFGLCATAARPFMGQVQ